MYSGHGGQACEARGRPARCHLSRSSAWHSPQRPCCCNPSHTVHQLRAAEIRDAHVGAGGGRRGGGHVGYSVMIHAQDDLPPRHWAGTPRGTQPATSSTARWGTVIYTILRTGCIGASGRRMHVAVKRTLWRARAPCPQHHLSDSVTRWVTPTTN
eukprot:2678110-Prymnesium_polylepis.2